MYLQIFVDRALVKWLWDETYNRKVMVSYLQHCILDGHF